MTPLSQLMSHSCDPSWVVARECEQVWRWHQFYDSVQGLVSVLRKRPEKKWLLFEENSYTFAIGLMALLHSDKTVLLPPNAQVGTLVDLTSYCDAMLGVSVRGFPSLDINQELVCNADIPALEALCSEQCFIEVMTSGSTGSAQIIKKRLSCFELELDCQYALWSESIKGCTIFSTVTHQHTYGLLFRTMLPLSAGLTFWSSTHQYPETLFADLLAYGDKAALVSSPAHLGRLPVRCNTQALSEKLAMVFSSGGPLNFSSALNVQQQLGTTAIEIFGSTESGGVAWRKQNSDSEPWTPLTGVEVNSSGEDGLLIIKSPYCFDGQWYPMSDVVVMQDDGRFMVMGRADRVVKIEEKRLSLTEMEARLQESSLIEQVKLLVLSGNRNQLAAVVLLSVEGRKLLDNNGKRAMNEAMKKLLLRYYERILLPKKWRYPVALPFNGMGKLPQAALAALFTALPEQ